MNPRNLIQSGLLELYALNLCSPEEKMQVEEAMAQDETVRKEYDEICEALDMLAVESSIEAPASLKEKVLAKIEDPAEAPIASETPAEKPIELPKTTPAEKPQPKPVQSESPISGGAKVVDLNRWKYMSAAAVALLVISLGFNVKFFSDVQNAEEQIGVLLQDKYLLSDENGTLSTEYKILKDRFSFFERDNLVSATLKGTPENEGKEAIVFWDKSKGDVFLVANNLPPLGKDEQYQLWAIDNEKPLGAGLIPQNHQEGIAFKMSNVSSSQAFAITVEKAGGAESPTLEKMVVVATI
ncbi:MAG: anti-sigma factor [Bacteroidetes bacterium]|nr:MAG: anti-sigma factor [Bacteroidota bacterium]